MRSRKFERIGELMREKIKGMGYMIWGIFGLAGIIFGITDAIFYNILLFPIIGIMTSLFFPEAFFKWMGKLLLINYIVSVIIFSIRIQGNFIGALLTGIIYTASYLILSCAGMLIVYLVKKFLNQDLDNSKRTFSGIGATLIIAFLLHASVNILGNPIVAMNATRAIEDYVAGRFEYPNLSVGQARYNRETSEYISLIQSKDEVDLHFYVAYQNGIGIVGDSYELSVLRFRNTISRLEDAYSQLILELMNRELPLTNNESKVWYDLDSLELNPEVLALGMELDVNLPLTVGVVLDFDMPKGELLEIAEIVTQAHRLFRENNYLFDSYSVSVKMSDSIVRIEGVSPLDIENGVVQQLLKGELAESMPSHINFEVLPE